MGRWVGENMWSFRRCAVWFVQNMDDESDCFEHNVGASSGRVYSGFIEVMFSIWASAHEMMSSTERSYELAGR